MEIFYFNVDGEILHIESATLPVSNEKDFYIARVLAALVRPNCPFSAARIHEIHSVKFASESDDVEDVMISGQDIRNYISQLINPKYEPSI